LTYLFLTHLGQIFALSGFWAGLLPRQPRKPRKVIACFFANLGIAMRPLLDKKLADKIANSAQILTDEEASLELDPT
jgi:hypothetical protein